MTETCEVQPVSPLSDTRSWTETTGDRILDITAKFLTALLLCAAVAAPCLSQDANALRGLSSLSVDFLLDDDIEGIVSDAEWREMVEGELRRVGLSVVAPDSEDARAYLVIAVTALPTTSLGLAYHLQLSVRDVVTRVDDESNRAFYGYTWQNGGIATVSRAEAETHLTSFMIEFLDEFLNSYLMVNAGT